MKRNSESTVLCGAAVLLTTFSDTLPFSLTNCGLFVIRSLQTVIQVVVEASTCSFYITIQTELY